jgi:5-methylthioribose kinase
MYLLDPQTTERYLRERGELAPKETVRVVELSGGVSNEVLLVERERGDCFVLKQAREQLRTRQEWKCDVRRIWREIDVLRLCGKVLDEAKIGRESGVSACVPEILFEDRNNYCYAMTAAPAEHQTWKQQLLAGKVDPALATAAGRMLGTLHAGTWAKTQVAELLGDQVYFEALRIDPYYRRIAEVHPGLRGGIEQLIDSLQQNRLSLVHGDFSPKNLLVFDRRLMLIDFEVGHYGDPAFDNGFCLTHLVIKAIWRNPPNDDYWNLVTAFWSAYRDVVRNVAGDKWVKLERRSILNLAGCLLARIDGKSPVDYLIEPQREQVRKFALELFRAQPRFIHDVIGHSQQL